LQVQGVTGRIDVGGAIPAAGAGARPVFIDGSRAGLSDVTVASLGRATL
jgi:hypothetical protein